MSDSKATPPIVYIAWLLAPPILAGIVWDAVAAVLTVFGMVYLVAFAASVNLGKCLGSWLGGGNFDDKG
ncbi:MAG: hypothetical protein R8M45_06525 [Ghiorsea sp.]